MSPLGTPAARAELVAPPGWVSGDVHVHQPDSCLGVSDPARVLDAMPGDLDLVSVLIWCSFGRFAADSQAHFRGQQDDPVSSSGRIVHYDLEVSFCGNSDRLAHGIYLNLTDIAFPASTYQGPIQEWALAQPGAIVGVAHANLFATGYHEYPRPGQCCVPFEAPLSFALGRADFIGYQPPATAGWRFLWYTLLDVGFRPGLAASSDAFCAEIPIGSARTYARIEGDLTYQKFVGALAAGRVVVVDEGGGFVELNVEGVGVGDQLDVEQPGTSVELRARLIAPAGLPIDGTLEILRNQKVIAALPFQDLEGEHLLTTSDVVRESSWYAARTDKSHSGAVYVVVGGRPIRASRASALYYVDYMDHLRTLVVSGAFQGAQPVDERRLLADIAAARETFGSIALQTVPEPGELVQRAFALAVVLSLRGVLRRP